MSRPLIVALHGVGSNARDMAAALVPLEAHGEIVALDGTEPFIGGGNGRQWFSVAGISDANRPARVVAAMPAFIDCLDILAAERGISRHELVLLGFSQGSIMTLAAVAGGHFHGRAIAVAGRLAAAVILGAQPAHLLLVHDRDDPVMPVELSVEAGTALSRAGHHVEGAWTSGIGHRVAGPMLPTIANWLAQSKNVTVR